MIFDKHQWRTKYLRIEINMILFSTMKHVTCEDSENSSGGGGVDGFQMSLTFPGGLIPILIFM